MRKFLALVALCCGISLHASVPADSIDTFIESEMPASGTPGLAYAVVSNGEISEADARGVMNAGGDTKVTPDTPFLTGSISKSFTALAVMQLVEAGKVSLDARLSQYLPGIADQPAGAITIRQLLSHTSGFSTYQGNISHTDGAGGSAALAHQAARIATITPAFPPGSKWEYSNLNYKLLGRVIEIVSGQDYPNYIRTNILEPVGMVNSFVADGKTHDEIATGHLPWFGTKRPLHGYSVSIASAPQGGIIASANDLARYMQMMINGENDILSAKGKAAMMRPASDVSPFYGFGWFLDAENGTVSHSGASPGTETLATMLPTRKKGVVVLVNAGSGIGFSETLQLRNGITARALGLDYNGEGSRFWQKVMFACLALLPAAFLLSMVWAWFSREQLRAKSGVFGLFSLWFPLLTTITAAGFLIFIVPQFFGASLATIRLFQPDTGLILIASAVAGVVWAIFRLCVAYSGKSGAG